MAYINGKEIWCSIGFDLYAPEIMAGTVKTLPSAAFEGATVLRPYALYGCKALERVELASSVTDIGSEAFYSCTALKSVVLPQELTHISTNAFLSCTALEGIDIPAKVDTIAGRAFQGCTALKTVTMRGNTPPKLVATAFNGVTLTSIIVPKGSADAYKAATNWSDYAEIITEAVE